jgi:hypothetical protein
MSQTTRIESFKVLKRSCYRPTGSVNSFRLNPQVGPPGRYVFMGSQCIVYASRMVDDAQNGGRFTVLTGYCARCSSRHHFIWQSPLWMASHSHQMVERVWRYWAGMTERSYDGDYIAESVREALSWLAGAPPRIDNRRIVIHYIHSSVWWSWASSSMCMDNR